MTNDIDESQDLTDPSAVKVGASDLRRMVLIVPLDAAIPTAVESAVVTGSLYERLQPLAAEAASQDDPRPSAIVPLSGPELSALLRLWPLLVTAKQVAVLSELPGVRPDIVFDSSARSIGLRLLPWVDVQEALTERVVTLQRTADKTPWVGTPPPARGFSATGVGRPAAPPATEDDASALP